MSDIPPEDIIFNNILTRLPAKSLIRFKCVCKSWCELFRNPNFIKMHLKNANEQKNQLSIMLPEHEYSRFNDPPYASPDIINTHVYIIDCDPSSYPTSSSSFWTFYDKRIEIDYPLRSSSHHLFLIWSYCNGLFCITTDRRKFIVLWNPCTGEYKDIPPAPFEDNPSIYGRFNDPPYARFSFAFGLWYDCKIDDYKVVSLVTINGGFSSQVMVYTLGSNSWGSHQTIPYAVTDLGLIERGHTPINGVLHWLATSYIGPEPSKVILCFDVVEERFKEMPLPNYMVDRTRLTAVGGSLGLLHYSPSDEVQADSYSEAYQPDAWDVWEMKEYGVIDSWTKVFTIGEQTPIGSSTPIRSYYDHEFLLEEDCEANWDALQFPVYVGSLVSLNSGTYAANTKEHHKMLREERERERDLLFSRLDISSDCGW